MGAKRGGPSYSGVQWLDVSMAMEDYEREYEGGYALIQLEPSGLGILKLTVKLWYMYGNEVYIVETVEGWNEASGRLQAFVYRSIIDNIKQIDRELAGRKQEDKTVT